MGTGVIGLLSFFFDSVMGASLFVFSFSFSFSSIREDSLLSITDSSFGFSTAFGFTTNGAFFVVRYESEAMKSFHRSNRPRFWEAEERNFTKRQQFKNSL